MSKEKWLIPEEKSRRIATAFIIAGVLVALFLIAIAGYLFVEMGYKNEERKRLDAEIERFEQLIGQQERDLDYYESELGRDHEALEQGWKTP